jgi:hypothetical protein
VLNTPMISFLLEHPIYTQTTQSDFLKLNSQTCNLTIEINEVSHTNKPIELSIKKKKKKTQILSNTSGLPLLFLILQNITKPERKIN